MELLQGTWQIQCPDGPACHWDAGDGVVASGEGTQEGRVFAVAGSDHFRILRGVECFDLATHAWTEAPAMGTARKCASAAVLGGKIYVMGGIDTGAITLSSVECFDPGTQAWSAAPAMGKARSSACAAVRRALVRTSAKPVGSRESNPKGPTSHGASQQRLQRGTCPGASAYSDIRNTQ